MAQQERRRILFVGGVAPHISEQALFEHFSQFSDLTKVRIMREKKTRESKGYAYITVADSRSIPHIMSVQHLILGRKLDVQLATSKGDKREWKVLQRCRRVYAVGLPPGTTNEQVAAAFQQFGEVRNAFVIREHESRIHREYAYIQFEDDRAAGMALSSVIKINGKVVACQPFGVGRGNKKASDLSQSTGSHEQYQPFFGGILGATPEHHPANKTIRFTDQTGFLDFAKPNQRQHHLLREESSYMLAYDSPSNYRFNLSASQTAVSRQN